MATQDIMLRAVSLLKQLINNNWEMAGEPSDCNKENVSQNQGWEKVQLSDHGESGAVKRHIHALVSRRHELR